MVQPSNKIFIDSNEFDPGDSFHWIKKELKQSTGEYIEKRIKNLKDDDYNDVFKCFFNKEVKQTLAFVQSSMEK